MTPTISGVTTSGTSKSFRRLPIVIVAILLILYLLFQYVSQALTPTWDNDTLTRNARLVSAAAGAFTVSSSVTSSEGTFAFTLGCSDPDPSQGHKSFFKLALLFFGSESEVTRFSDDFTCEDIGKHLLSFTGSFYDFFADLAREGLIKLQPHRLMFPVARDAIIRSLFRIIEMLLTIGN